DLTTRRTHAMRDRKEAISVPVAFEGLECAGEVGEVVEVVRFEQLALEDLVVDLEWLTSSRAPVSCRPLSVAAPHGLPDHAPDCVSASYSNQLRAPVSRPVLCGDW